MILTISYLRWFSFSFPHLNSYNDRLYSRQFCSNKVWLLLGFQIQSSEVLRAGKRIFSLFYRFRYLFTRFYDVVCSAWFLVPSCCSPEFLFPYFHKIKKIVKNISTRPVSPFTIFFPPKKIPNPHIVPVRIRCEFSDLLTCFLYTRASSFFDITCPIYRKAKDSYILILHPCT